MRLLRCVLLCSVFAVTGFALPGCGDGGASPIPTETETPPVDDAPSPENDEGQAEAAGV